MSDADHPEAVHPDDTPSNGDATAAENTARLDSLRSRWESDPTSKIYLQLAEEYRKAGRFDEAIEVLETSLEHRPRDPRGRVALARCRLELGDAAAAAELLEHVTRQDPAHVVANKLQLEAYLQLGDIDKATERLNLYRLLNDRDPELDHFVYRLERLRDTPPTDASPGGAADEAAAGADDSTIDGADEPSDVISIDDAVPTLPPPVESFHPDAEPPIELEMIDDSAAEEPVEFEAAEIPMDEDHPDDELAIEWAEDDEAAAAESIELAPEPELAVPAPEPAFDALDEPSAEPETPTFDDIETSPVASDEPTFDDIEESPRTAEEPAFEALSSDHAELAPDESESMEGDAVEVAAESDVAESEIHAEGAVDDEGSSSNDLFDLAPPPAPDLDDLFGLAALPPAPAPSLDGLWGDTSETADETVIEPAEAAVEPAEAAVEADPAPTAPSREAATVTLGQLYLQQGHLDEAERIFQEVLDRDPEQAAALDGLAEVRARSAAADEESPPGSAAEPPIETDGDRNDDAPDTDDGTVDDDIAVDAETESEGHAVDEADDEEEDTAVSQAIAIQALPVEAPSAEAPPLEALAFDAPSLEATEPETLEEEEEEEEEDTAVSQAVAIQAPPVESPPVESPPVEGGASAETPDADDDEEEDTAVSQAVAIQPSADGLDAATLLADRSIDTVPEGLTAKKILVLRQYARHLRQAADHVQ